eukprot:jgi/Psemu1/17822/gm1.17822_g
MEGNDSAAHPTGPTPEERASRLQSEAERRRRWLAEQQQPASAPAAARDQEIDIAFSSSSSTLGDESSVSSSSSNSDPERGLQEELQERIQFQAPAAAAVAAVRAQAAAAAAQVTVIETRNSGTRSSEMVYYNDKVPKLSNVGEVDFEGWYRQFEAHADQNKYEEMLTEKAHPDLPPEGILTPWEDLSKAQKKALKKHSRALNNLYKAFNNNSTGYAIIKKSKIDREGTTETNAKLKLQWPWGRVHQIIEELMREYWRKTGTRDRQLLNKDLQDLKLSAAAPPKELFENLFALVQKYQYKAVSPTLDELCAAFLNTLPPYLLMPLTNILDDLRTADIPEFLMWEKLQHKATNLLFGAEMTDVGNSNTYKRDRWAKNAAFQCEKRKAGHPKVEKKANSDKGNNSSGRSNGKPKGRPKCGICGGMHRDANCWEDEKNASKRPDGWTSKLKDVQEATIDYDFCLSAIHHQAPMSTSLQLLHAQKQVTKGDTLPEEFDLLYDNNVFVFDTGATSHSSNIMRCATNLQDSGATITTQSGNELKGCKVGDILCEKVDKDGKYEHQTLLQGNGWVATGSNKIDWPLQKGSNKVNFDIQIPTYTSCVWVGYFQRIADNGQDIGAVTVTVTATTTTSKGTKMSITKAHQLLGHMDEEKTQKTAAALGWTITRGAMKPCEDCAKAKAKRKVIPTESQHQAATKPIIFLLNPVC